MSSDLPMAAERLRTGADVEGARVLKRSPVRVVVRIEDVFLKVFMDPRGQSGREARALLEAGRRAVPVPQLLDHGPGWLATRWIEGRPAVRGDLAAILAVVDRMHGRGMLHRDLHLGNLIVGPSGLVVTDLQRSRFQRWLPGWVRRRELGWLAYSLGEPLPDDLAEVRFWRDRRAQTHWRSRTRRCTVESGSFTRFRPDGHHGFRIRDSDPEELVRVFQQRGEAEVLKDRPGGRLLRSGPWVLKEHPSERAARRSWINGHGLEVRGIRTGRGVAWAGHWLVMEDAGPTVTDWIESDFDSAGPEERTELAEALGGLLGDLHRRGIYHADLKANNIAWAPGQRPRLLDYGVVRFRHRLSTRRRTKNLAQLNAALPDPVKGPLREHAFRRYLEQSEFRGSSERLRSRVIDLSLSRKHRWHGC